jgi:hypothetical protein
VQKTTSTPRKSDSEYVVSPPPLVSDVTDAVVPGPYSGIYLLEMQACRETGSQNPVQSQPCFPLQTTATSLYGVDLLSAFEKTILCSLLYNGGMLLYLGMYDLIHTF